MSHLLLLFSLEAQTQRLAGPQRAPLTRVTLCPRGGNWSARLIYEEINTWKRPPAVTDIGHVHDKISVVLDRITREHVLRERKKCDEMERDGGGAQEMEGGERGEDKELIKEKPWTTTTQILPLARKKPLPLTRPLQVAGMDALPVVLLLCGFHVFTAGAQSLQTESTSGPFASDCREEMYPCTRMYSVHQPIKRCIGALCLYSLQRMYVINNEICMRTVCPHGRILES
ncbi:hypothetical protein WMY93_025964 [Mugilogobius chulae]|uniref:Microfibril associated protein 5 n=1 Tax=Mugilogobius chulae TaxID=88201 RepID=A0AAW0N0M9_9GOBI